jgi:RimJ/RimL family protein N-acetyltransferase
MATVEAKTAARDAKQGQVVVRPATREDIAAFSPLEGKPTLKAWLAEIDDEAVALGGLALVKGRWIGFLDITERGRDCLKRNLGVRVAMIRAVFMVLSEAKKQGVRYIYAQADTNFPKAAELLEKFGFSLDPRSQFFHRWTPK